MADNTKTKIKGYGVKDMLYFAGKPNEREKVIEATEVRELQPTSSYDTNRKAVERHPDTQEFIVDRIIPQMEDVKTFRFRKADGSDPAFFRAGQYVTVRQIIDGKLVARPISISSGPADTLNKGYIEITVKRNPAGYMSGWMLDNLKEGDSITTSGPQGVFYYDSFRDEANVIAVAGGSGITPVLSMARAIASGDENFNLTVLAGSRTRKDILFADDFEDIMKRTSKVRFIPVLSNEKVEGMETGFVNAELIRKYAGDEAFSLFASGPQGMYAFLDQEVAKLGLDPKHYRKEIFGVTKKPWEEAGYPQVAKDQIFRITVRMSGQEYVIEASANETILTSFERAGIAGPNRCRGGICGYCRSRLLTGDVFIPKDTDGRRQADRKYGYIHPCATFAVSDLVLEVPANK